MGLYIVSGAASGIGAAICRRLKNDGEHVITLDRNHADINVDLSTASGRAAAVAACQELADQGLDGLVCCAGIGGSFPQPALIPAVNFFGSIELVKGLKAQLQSAQGNVVLVSSNSASQSRHLDYVNALLAEDRKAVELLMPGLDAHQAYSGSKQAVARWLRKHAPDYARLGIRMNAVAPGYTRTAMTAEAESHPDFSQSIKNFLNSIPLGRAGEAENIADAIGFLLSREAAFVCGSVLYVDGGHDAVFRPDIF